MINIDSWISCDNGLCQVVAIQNEINVHPLVENIPNLVWYKILCDYSGKLRKGRYFNFSNLENCQLLTSKEVSVIEDIKDSFPIEFKKHLDRKPKTKPKSSIDLSIRAEKSKIDFTISILTTRLNNICKPFSFQQFIDDINSSEVYFESGLLPKTSDTLSSNIMISIDCELFGSEDQLTFLSGSVFKTYCRSS